MKKQIKRVAAFFVMPLTFMIVGYGFAMIAIAPFYDMGVAISRLLIMDQRPVFSQERVSILDEDFVFEEVTELSVSDIELPRHGTHFAHLRNTRIGLSAPVYWGDSYEILRHGVGNFMGSFLPGFKGTTLLAGHNTTHFLPLQDVEVGDVFELTTNYARFEYKVTDLRILNHRDRTAIDLGQQDQDTLVMYTCYPFDQIVGIPTLRLFVYAERITGPDIVYQH